MKGSAAIIAALVLSACGSDPNTSPPAQQDGVSEAQERAMLNDAASMLDPEATPPTAPTSAVPPTTQP